MKGDPDPTRHANISIFFPRTKPSPPECRVWGSSQFTYALRTWGEVPSLERSDRLNGQDRAPVCTYGMMRVPEVKRYIVTKRKTLPGRVLPACCSRSSDGEGIYCMRPGGPPSSSTLIWCRSRAGERRPRTQFGLTSPLEASLNAFSLSYADRPVTDGTPVACIYI